MKKVKRGFLIYGLINPKSDKICYIGYTTQLLSTRLRQHNNPVTNNNSKVAKLLRHLIKENLKFSIVEIDDCINEKEMYKSEIKHIKEYSEKGYKLYNLQEGGCSSKNPVESYKKAYKTALKRGTFLKSRKGSENEKAVLNENEVLEIYKLIKQNYSNEEIYKKYNIKCKISTIKALRNGQNWQHLWNLHFDKKINSLKCLNSGYNPRIKLKIIDLIEKNYELNHIHKWFQKVSKSDLKRIKNQEIWKPIRKRYEELKRPNQVIDLEKFCEFGETLNK